MPLRLNELQDRFRATVLGFAVGDALGFPLRGLPPNGMSRVRSLADDFAARPRGRFGKGQFSDDTQVLLAVAEAVAKEGRVDGRAAAAHLSWLWQEGVVLEPPRSVTRAAEALLEGEPWMSTGAELGVKEPSCLSRAVVVGLWCDDAHARLAHDAQVVTVMTHKDPACTAAVSALARGIQLGLAGESLTANAFCEALAQAAQMSDAELADEIFYLPRVLGWEPERALAALRRIGVSQAQLDAEAGLPAHLVPVLLTGVYAFLKVGHDVREALNLVLRCGGEVDVAAGVTGALLGAHLGSEPFPARLRKHLLYAEAITEAADRLFDARLHRMDVAVSRVGAARR